MKTSEHAFMRHLLLALGSRPDVRLWRQNVARIPVRDDVGRIQRVFHSGPPRGAADLSGIIRPEGWRLEIEVKAVNGKRSAPQERWGKFIRRSGGIYMLAELNPELSMRDNVQAIVHRFEAILRERRGLL